MNTENESGEIDWDQVAAGAAFFIILIHVVLGSWLGIHLPEGFKNAVTWACVICMVPSFINHMKEE